MNYNEARMYLEEVGAKGNRLGLLSIRALLRELENPQDDLTFIHIAGTNGKGSVLSFLASVLGEAGYRAGRYVSPALFSYEEKIRIGEDFISKEEVAALITEIAAARERAAHKGEPESTIFEVETAMSFLYFRQKRCDLVLLETGMGGRDDATNAVDHTILEIFTPISLDHMAFLGETTEEIARVKAGIIKKNSRVVSAGQEEDVLRVLQEVCKEQGANLEVVQERAVRISDSTLTGQHFSYKGLEKCEIRLAGRHQVFNAALALEAVFALRELGYDISDQAVFTGLEKARWEGRLQVMQDSPLVIIDGAHNPGAVTALMDTVEKQLPGRELIYIIGMFADKDYREVVRLSAPRAKKIYTIETRNNPRALNNAVLREEAARYCPSAEESPGAAAALRQALSVAGKDDVILIFGSLSFLWEIKEFYENRDNFQSSAEPDRLSIAENQPDNRLGNDDSLSPNPDALLAREAVLYMEQQGWRPDRAGLARMRELMRRLGNPQKELSYVHVAGSNGKGSTCAMLDQILREAGYRTGLFTSPHLLSYHERIRFCGRQISDKDLARLVYTVRDYARGMEEKPNQFELGTAAAFLYFRQMHCELVILEAGMGGELDCTNVIDAPEAAVITNIALEHTQYLGNTLSAIAAAKAGIIKEDCPVVCYDQKQEVMQVIEDKVREKNASLYQADFSSLHDMQADLSGQEFCYKGQTYHLGLLGRIQLSNAAVVLECIEALRKKGWLIPEEAVRRGLERVKWPCRFELVLPDPVVIVDGAHNPQGTAVCLEEARRYLPGKKFVIVLGLLADKDYEQMLDMVAGAGSFCICITPRSERALPGSKAAAYLKEHGLEAAVADTFEEAAAMALEMTKKDADAVLCLGSLHAAGYLAEAFRRTKEKGIAQI